MSDLEPASALASRVVGDLFDSTGERADVWRVEQLIESDRAAVREPLERQVRELTARANELPGLTATLDELRFVVALVGECLAEHDAANGTLGYGVQPDNAITARIRGALQALDGKLEDYPDDLAKRAARIASLEAQLASAREGCWRPAASELPPDAFTRLVWCGFRTVAFCEDGKWWRVGEEGKNVELTGVHFWRDLPEGPSIERVHAALIAAEQATSCHCGTPSLAHDVACPQHEDAAQKEPHGR